MKKIICLLKGHRWSQWYNNVTKDKQYRYCSRCSEIEYRIGLMVVKANPKREAKMKALFKWWFSLKRASSVIKILIGLLICYSFFDALIRNIIDLIDAFVNPPLYLGTSYLFLPVISNLFTKAILWSGLFYLPYCIFGKRSEGRKRYLIPILLVVLILGSGFAGAIYTKPSAVEITRTQLALLEARLGEMNKIGEFYTVREFSYDIAK